MLETLRPITLARLVTISAYNVLSWTEEQLVHGWLRDTLRATEFHELDEWYRLDGKQVVDPHPKQKGKRP